MILIANILFGLTCATVGFGITKAKGPMQDLIMIVGVIFSSLYGSGMKLLGVSLLASAANIAGVLAIITFGYIIGFLIAVTHTRLFSK